MYSIKQGVSIFISHEIEKMLSAVCNVYAAFQIPVVITSGLDGPHRENSLHGKFLAFDIRKNFDGPAIYTTWSIHRDFIMQSVLSEFKRRNIPGVFLEEEDHIHIEWNETEKV